MTHPALVLAALATLLATPAFAADRHTAAAAEVTILSSNLADAATVGEWGFSALLRTDGRCILFDAGRYPDTVLRNAEALGVDLSCVAEVVLSHFHFDHTSGLLPLLDSIRARNPDGMRRIHVAAGFFRARRIPARGGDTEANGMIAMRSTLEARGVEFEIHDRAAEIAPAVWVTGPVTRAHDEKTYPTAIRILEDGEWIVDYVPDSQGLVVVTAEGPIVLLGCGHSGSVNLLEQVRRDIQDHSIHALMGGMHLYSASDETLDWTTRRLGDIGVQNLMAGHCTGIEPMIRMREAFGLSREHVVIGAVGSRFVLGEGIHPTDIAR